jgi:hypothetical protein
VYSRGCYRRNLLEQSSTIRVIQRINLTSHKGSVFIRLQSAHRPTGRGISTGEMNDILLCIYSNCTALHSYDAMHSHYASSTVSDY